MHWRLATADDHLTAVDENYTIGRFVGRLQETTPTRPEFDTTLGGKYVMTVVDGRYNQSIYQKTHPYQPTITVKCNSNSKMRGGSLCGMRKETVIFAAVIFSTSLTATSSIPPSVAYRHLPDIVGLLQSCIS